MCCVRNTLREKKIYMGIGIKKIGSVSAIGGDIETIMNAYTVGLPAFSFSDQMWSAPVHAAIEKEIEHLLQKHPRYQELDRTVHLGILALERIISVVSENELQDIPLHVGSSRGATAVWEIFHRTFLEGNPLSPKASPLTTAGNIASNIAHHFNLNHAVFNHSLTCSSGMQSISNGFAWIKSGMSERFFAVASEAPLTAFTKAQVRSLGIASKLDKIPCRPLSKKDNGENTMVLGEAASAVLLEKMIAGENYLATISGIGYGVEKLHSPSGISKNGDAFQKSMTDALKMSGCERPDLIVCHAPGTFQGDASENKAIELVFGKKMSLVSTKHLTGHTYGVSGLLSLELALFILNGFKKFEFPYPVETDSVPAHPKVILINTIGFGGNACSIVIEKS